MLSNFVRIILSASCLLWLTSARFVQPERRLQAKKQDEPECPRMYAPYMSSIRNLDGGHQCGGVVIAEDAVLTSAACVDLRLVANLAHQPTVHIGGIDSDNPVQTKSFYIIAGMGTGFMPVKFIGKRKSKQKTFMAFGYGRTAAAGTFTASDLQGANVTFISRSKCNSRFKLPNKVTWGEVCFKSTAGGSALCGGDEGGPILHAPFSPVYEDSLIAIAAYTVGECDDSNSIAIATNIRKFRGWITATLESEAFGGAKKTKKTASKKTMKPTEKRQEKAKKN